LMATSALLWESPLTGSTLYLPRTPPRSLVRSTAIWAPTAQATDPAAAKGPFLIDCYNDKPWSSLRKPFEYS